MDVPGRRRDDPATVAAATTRAVMVRGSGLAAIASALRLAKVGHQVTLDTGGEPLGGHWAASANTPDELPQTFALRAAWMDLFKKSGRAFDAELGRAGLDLVPAPAVRHVFPDGIVLDLPAERGAQFHAIEHVLGRTAATAWSELLDRGDDVWFALRMAGLERPAPADWDRQVRERLWAGRTLDDLAGELPDPHLGTLVRDLAPQAGSSSSSAPALLLSRAVIERQFGRWHLVDADGWPQPAGRLLDLLVERLATRHVDVVRHPDAAPPDTSGYAAVLDARPASPDGWLARRRAPAALAPSVRHLVLPGPPHDAGSGAPLANRPGHDTPHHDTPHHDTQQHGIQQVVHHGPDGVVVRWHRPLPDGSQQVVEHDHRQARPDPAWGLEPRSWRAIAARPGLRAPGPEPTWRASASSPGGNEPWAELLSAALAVYDLHEHLTGADIRPTNKALTTHRRPARASRRTPPATA